MNIDFLLIGHGLAGSVLGYRLKQSGKTIRIIDEPQRNQSSKVAAGLYNPITGRKMVKTWNADKLFPEIKPLYQNLEELTGLSFLIEKNIYRPFLSFEELNEWMGKSAEESFEPYIERIFDHSQSAFINDPYGGVLLKNCGWLKINELLKGMENYFKEEILFQHFDESKLQRKDDKWEYEGFRAKSIVFCNGLGAMNSSFFSYLPFAPVKGEILEVKQDFAPEFVLNRGVFRVGLGEGLFRVGSTYTKDDLDQGATDRGREELLRRLGELVNEPTKKIVSHKFGIRPATRDRKPFLGKHPAVDNVYSFNGFGAKGVSLIPYLSKIFVKLILEGEPLPKEVDIARYFKYI